MRRGRFLQGQNLVDEWLDAAIREWRNDCLAEFPGDVGFLLNRARAEYRTNDLLAPDHRRAEIDLRPGATHQTDDHQSPAQRQGLQVACQVEPAQMVEDIVAGFLLSGFIRFPVRTVGR